MTFINQEMLKIKNASDIYIFKEIKNLSSIKSSERFQFKKVKKWMKIAKS